MTMTKNAVWVGHCLVQTTVASPEPHQHPWNAQCYAAVQTDSAKGFAQAVRNHCQEQGHCLVWSEQVYPILDWLNRHGHHNTVMSLAKTIDGHHGIAVSPLVPRNEAGNPLPVTDYLEITQHSIPPLPDQSDKPFWTQDWITPELKELVFGQSSADKSLRTYLIVDATLRKNITGIFDLYLTDVPVRSLVRPEMADALLEVAPYLIDITLSEEHEVIPEFHKNFFTDHWHRGTGILLRTAADMNTVWTHFHQFVRIQTEKTKEWFFFRFWDPDITPDYFDSIKHFPEKIAQWFCTSNGDHIKNIISCQAGAEQPWYIAPMWNNLKDIPRIEKPMLSDTEMAGLEHYFENKTIARISKAIQNVAPVITQTLGAEDLQKTIRSAISQAKEYSIVLDTDIAYFSLLSCIHTPDWHQHKYYSDINAVLHDNNVAPYLKMDLIKNRYRKKFSDIRTAESYQKTFSEHPRLSNILYFDDFCHSLDIDFLTLR